MAPTVQQAHTPDFFERIELRSSSASFGCHPERSRGTKFASWESSYSVLPPQLTSGGDPKIVREEGFWELYRGLVPSVIGVVPYAASNYYAYDTFKNVHKRVTNRQTPEPFETLIMGSLSGALASTLTFPLEVARKQMQVGALEGRVVYRSTTHAIQSIVREEGVKGLYRGLGASCMKLMPAAGISFMCYEVFKQALLEDRLGEGQDKQQTQQQQQQQQRKEQ